MIADPHRGETTLFAGQPPSEASGALICVHGRGATADDILDLGRAVTPPSWSLLAPQAARRTWYPGSFLLPLEQNQPWLDSGLRRLDELVEGLVDAGVSRDRVALLGFSQGACLALEWAGRNPARYAAVLGLTGGYQGPADRQPEFAGAFDGTPVLLSCGDPDPHVPWARVEATADVFRSLGAAVTIRRWPGRPHTVTAQEVEIARELLRQVRGTSATGS